MLLFIVNSFSTTGISQDTTYTKFIEAGGGMGYSESMHGAFNGGLTFFFIHILPVLLIITSFMENRALFFMK